MQFLNKVIPAIYPTRNPQLLQPKVFHLPMLVKRKKKIICVMHAKKGYVVRNFTSTLLFNFLKIQSPLSPLLCGDNKIQKKKSQTHELTV